LTDESGTLRPATLADLDIVASWIGSARECELWAGWRVRFPIDRAALPETIGFSESNALSLADRQEVVAFGQLVIRGARRVHLARIIVAPDRRRSGYGAALVQGLIARARRDWFERVSLNVDEANRPAIGLYSNLGFRDAQRPVDEPESPRSRYMEYRIVDERPVSR
jgi:[ribosomal protein S18]-alanine N-acetyltransferase